MTDQAKPYSFRCFVYSLKEPKLCRQKRLPNFKDLPEKQQMAILGLIDMKVENEVQKVIHKLEQIDKGLNLKYNVLLGAITLLALLISIFKFLG